MRDKALIFLWNFFAEKTTLASIVLFMLLLQNKKKKFNVQRTGYEFTLQASV